MTAIACTLRLPQVFSFQYFGFADAGSVLQTDLAVSEGLRPGLDFGYPYGLLTLGTTRLWFALLGRSPLALLVLIVSCEFVFALGLVRCVRALQLRLRTALLLVVALPLMTAMFGVGACHALEPALLIHALADWAGGRPARSLAFAGIAVLVKPSMGFVCAAVFCALLLLRLVQRRSSRAEVGRVVLPALAVAAGAVVLLTVFFGLDAVRETVLPLYGRSVYRAQGFGFFVGDGRNFWHPQGANLFYYLGTPAGVWLLLSGTVIGAGSATLWRLVRMPRPRLRETLDRARLRQETLVVCAACLVLWVLFLFGNGWSWSYYFYFVVLGSTLWLDMRLEAWRAVRFAPMVIAGLALVALRSEGAAVVTTWRTWERGPDTYGLWAPRAVRTEWTRVQAALQGRLALGSLFMGGLEVLDRRFVTPRHGMLIVGASTPAMRRELQRRLDAAGQVVVEKFLLGPAGLRAHELSAVRSWRIVWDGPSFLVLRR